MVKKVFKLYWDKDAEEKWLNQMSNKGWALTNFYLGVYTFKECENGEYCYRIDLMKNIASSKESMDYIKLVEETGAEYVSSWFRWVFFRKKVSNGEFELYTDIESKIRSYKEIRKMFGILGVAEICIGIGQIGNLSVNNYFNIYAAIATILVFSLAAILLRVTIKTTNKIKELEKEHSIKD
jgi:hypothetical protein